MVLYEFDDCYERQIFYKGRQPVRKDLSKMEGVCGYCDEEAAAQLRESIDETNELSFLGNGNFHYVSYFLLRPIQEQFSLLVLDHHPDLQPPFWGEMLSCGCWIKYALENLPLLQEVMVVGVERSLLEELARTEGFLFCGEEQGVFRYKKDGKPILCVEESLCAGDCHRDEGWRETIRQQIRETLRHPIYVSVDKDVLTEDACVTNWDGGSMTLETMREVLNCAAEELPLLGMDVCGEWDGREIGRRERSETILSKNNRCNQMLSEWWEEQKKARE